MKMLKIWVEVISLLSIIKQRFQQKSPKQNEKVVSQINTKLKNLHIRQYQNTIKEGFLTFNIVLWFRVVPNLIILIV